MSNVQTGELLSFGDYSPDHGTDRSARIEVESVHTNSYSTGTAAFGETPKVDIEDDQPATATNHNFWTIEYYQKYFDVQTNEVIERIVSSVVPLKVSPNYFDERIRGKPDLYGPFWICTTLIFTIGVSSNIASYFQNYHKPEEWRYDFHRLSYAATAIFTYVWLLPLALWAALRFSSHEDSLDEQNPSTPSMMSLFCLYGYSLSIYIPVCILWTIQVTWLQWLLVFTAAAVSGLVLIFWLLPALKKSRFFLPLLALIMGLHLLLAGGFMLYFFHDGSSPVPIPTTTTLRPSVMSNNTH